MPGDMKNIVISRLKSKHGSLPHLPNEILVLILHSIPVENLTHAWTSVRLVNRMFKSEVEGHVRKTLLEQIRLVIECGKSAKT